MELQMIASGMSSKLSPAHMTNLELSASDWAVVP